jgi:hypothetical protein
MMESYVAATEDGRVSKHTQPSLIVQVDSFSWSLLNLVFVASYTYESLSDLLV